ncbi:hypothetical protein [Mycolicibacterium phlei]
MLLSLTVVSAVLAAWALGAKHLERWRLTAPMVLVIAGLAVGFSTRDGLAESLNTEVSQHIAEVILAVLLFVDATDIRGGLFGREPRAVMRLLFIALPLSVLAALALGLWLLQKSALGGAAGVGLHRRADGFRAGRVDPARRARTPAGARRARRRGRLQRGCTACWR